MSNFMISLKVKNKASSPSRSQKMSLILSKSLSTNRLNLQKSLRNLLKSLMSLQKNLSTNQLYLLKNRVSLLTSLLTSLLKSLLTSLSTKQSNLLRNLPRNLSRNQQKKFLSYLLRNLLIVLSRSKRMSLINLTSQKNLRTLTQKLKNNSRFPTKMIRKLRLVVKIKLQMSRLIKQWILRTLISLNLKL